MKRQTIGSILDGLTRMPHPQIPNTMNPLTTPQVAAVHQTLAGERLTCQVNFPMTGDAACDFIQGILAVEKAIDLHPAAVLPVLRYMIDRYGRELDNQKQPTQFAQVDWQSLVQQAVKRELYEQQVLQQMPPISSPWTGQSISAGQIGTPGMHP